jgi:hypothetical protein
MNNELKCSACGFVLKPLNKHGDYMCFNTKCDKSYWSVIREYKERMKIKNE